MSAPVHSGKIQESETKVLYSIIKRFYQQIGECGLTAHGLHLCCGLGTSGWLGQGPQGGTQCGCWVTPGSWSGWCCPGWGSWNQENIRMKRQTNMQADICICGKHLTVYTQCNASTNMHCTEVKHWIAFSGKYYFVLQSMSFGLAKSPDKHCPWLGSLHSNRLRLWGQRLQWQETSLSHFLCLLLWDNSMLVCHVLGHLLSDMWHMLIVIARIWIPMVLVLRIFFLDHVRVWWWQWWPNW